MFSEQLKLGTDSPYNKENQAHLVNKTKVAGGMPTTIRFGNPKSSTARRKKCCFFCHLSGHTRAYCSIISKYGQCLSVRVQNTESAKITKEKYVLKQTKSVQQYMRKILLQKYQPKPKGSK